MSTPRESFRDRIPTLRDKRRYDGAVDKLARAVDRLEHATDAKRAARRLVAESRQEMRLIRNDMTVLMDRVDLEPPPRREPPVTVDPPPTAHSMADAPERVEPVLPQRCDAMVFANGTYALCELPHVGAKAGMARDAYAAVESILDAPRQIVLGIEGNVGRVSMGHAYSKYSDDLFKSAKGWPIDVAFVGDDDSAAVGPVFLGSNEQDAGVFDVCDRAQFFSVGINGEKGTYAFRQHGYCREFSFDKVWINPDPSVSMYMSAFMLHKDWESMTLKGYDPRGLRLAEHVAYGKGGGFTQVLDCNLYGGRRTGYQWRPHGEDADGHAASPTRHGDFISDGNYADGFGFNHSEASGGQWLTHWFSGEYKTRISNNRCTDARYGCLGISKGVHSSNPYLTEDGLSHSNVYIWGNEFENKRASRTCVSLADARMIHFGEGNDFTGPDHGSHTMVFGSQWGSKNAGAQVPKNWAWYGERARPTWPVHIYHDGVDAFVMLTETNHRAHLAKESR